MKTLIASLAALAVATPAVASDLGCWNTADISENPSAPAGTYVADGATADYINPGNEGVIALFGGLSSFDDASFVICLQGQTTTDGGDTVLQVSAAIICPSSVFVDSSCPD